MPTVTLSPTAATYVDWRSPTTNFSGDTFGGVGFLGLHFADGTRPRWRPLLKFDLSSIPAGAKITAALLRCFVNDMGSGPISANAEAMRTAWTQGGATWNNSVLADETGVDKGWWGRPIAPISAPSIFLGSSVGASAPNPATTVYVSPSGNDANPGTSASPVLTFAHAATLVSNGWTIYFRAGTYAGGHNFSGVNNLTLRGDAGAILDGSALGAGVSIVKFTACSYPTVLGLRLTGGPYAGVMMVTGDHLTVDGCELDHNGNNGVLVANSPDGVVCNSLCHDNDGHGIYFSQSSDRCRALYNRCYSNTRAGIQINANEGAAPTGDPNHDQQSDGCEVRGNTIYLNGSIGGAAINLAGVINSLFVNNLLYQNLAGGIACFDDGLGNTYGCKNNAFYHNTVLFDAGVGRYCFQFITGSTGNTLKNNILSISNGGGNPGIDTDASTVALLTSDYNLFDTPAAAAVDTSSLATWQGAHGQDAHSLTGAPNLDAVTFIPNVGSPALDVGVFVDGLDLVQTVRPQGTGVDLGALERVVAALPPPSVGGWAEWEVRRLVNAWLDGTIANNGLTLAMEIGGDATFARLQDETAANPPQLVITYTTGATNALPPTDVDTALLARSDAMLYAHVFDVPPVWTTGQTLFTQDQIDRLAAAYATVLYIPDKFAIANGVRNRTAFAYAKTKGMRTKLGISSDNLLGGLVSTIDPAFTVAAARTLGQQIATAYPLVDWFVVDGEDNAILTGVGEKHEPGPVGQRVQGFAKGIHDIRPTAEVHYSQLGGTGTVWETYVAAIVAAVPDFLTDVKGVGGAEQGVASRWDGIYTESLEFTYRYRGTDQIRAMAGGALVALVDESLVQVPWTLPAPQTGKVVQAKMAINAAVMHTATGKTTRDVIYKLMDLADIATQPGGQYQLMSKDMTDVYVGYYAIQRLNQYLPPRTFAPCSFGIGCSNPALTRYGYRDAAGSVAWVAIRNPLIPTDTVDPTVPATISIASAPGLVPLRVVDPLTGAVATLTAADYTISGGLVSLSVPVRDSFTLVEFGPPAIVVSSAPLFHWRARVTAVDGAAPGFAQLYTFSMEVSQFSTLVGATATGGAWTPLKAFGTTELAAALAQYPNSQNPAGSPVVLVLSVTPNGTAKVTVELEITWDDTGHVDDCVCTLGHSFYSGNLAFSGLGFVLYVDDAGQNRAADLLAYVKRVYLDPLAVNALPAGQRPKRLLVQDRVMNRGDDLAYPLATVGFGLGIGNSLMEADPSAAIRAQALLAGQTGARPSQATIGNTYVPYGIANEATFLTAYANGFLAQFLAAGYVAADLVQIKTMDEPGMYNPNNLNALLADANAVARFQAYLRGDYAAQQGPPVGFTPADFGQASWAAVLPVGRSTVAGVSPSLAARRLWVWSQRFQSWDASRWAGAAAAALQAKAAAAGRMHIVANLNNYQGRFCSPSGGPNNTHLSDPDASSIAYDLYELNALGTDLWGEDWFPDGSAFLTSYYISRYRGAAEGRPFGFYMIPLQPGKTAWGPQQKVLANFGNGAFGCYHYLFGPNWLFPGSPYSEYPDTVPKLALAHRRVAAAESYLVGATWQGARVAILAPRSSYSWDMRTEAPNTVHPVGDLSTYAPYFGSVDYMVEQFGLWWALTRQGIPVQWLYEPQLTADRLANLDVIYVTEQHVPAEGRAALLAWAQLPGKVLALAPNALSRDAYDTDDTAASDLSGIVANRRDAAYSHNNSDTSLGTVTGPGGSPVVYGPWATLSVAGGAGATVYATRSDAAPGIIIKPVGQGTIVYYTFFPGMSHWRSQSGTVDGLPTGFSTVLEDWVRKPCDLAGVTLPAQHGIRGVELQSWQSPLGLCVYCGNWTGADLPGFQLTVPLTRTAGASLASGGPISVGTSGGSLVATFTLGAGHDFVLFPVAPTEPTRQATATLKVGIKRPLPAVLKGTPCRWSVAAGKQERVTVAASGWTALTPPAGARAVCIVGAASGMRLTGASGDVGIPLAARVPTLLPLGDGVTVGIRNTGAARVVTVYWM